MKRLDVYLFEHGYADSREKAKKLIEDGAVMLDGKPAPKPSAKVGEGAQISISDSGELRYVGRGALKLKRAFEVFPIKAEGMVCADIGASTGGFTQVLLEHGAGYVYAVDVGHGQLAPSLKSDSRVENREGVNARSIPQDFFDRPVRLAVGDLSFISLRLVLPVVAAALPRGAQLVFLIKPQFEAGRSAVGKKGIVSDVKTHISVLRGLCEFFAGMGLSLRGLDCSPICGGDGNREYLAFLIKDDLPPQIFDLREIAERAFREVR